MFNIVHTQATLYKDESFEHCLKGFWGGKGRLWSRHAKIAHVPSSHLDAVREAFADVESNSQLTVIHVGDTLGWRIRFKEAEDFLEYIDALKREL